MTFLHHVVLQKTKIHPLEKIQQQQLQLSFEKNYANKLKQKSDKYDISVHPQVIIEMSRKKQKHYKRKGHRECI